MSSTPSKWKEIDLKKLITKCKKCYQPTKLIVRSELPDKIKDYMYTLKTYCNNCKIGYLVDVSKLNMLDTRIDNWDKNSSKLKTSKQKHIDHIVSLDYRIAYKEWLANGDYSVPKPTL